MKNNLKITVIVFLLSLFTFYANAQQKKIKKSFKPKSSSSFKGCPVNLVSKKGEVFSVAPKVLTTKATSNNITVRIKKTGGRAKTTVNIYVNNNLEKRIIFQNGVDFPVKEKKLSGVKGKNIKVEIVNQSVGNSFKYKATISGKRKSLMANGKPATGTLIGQGFKNVFTTKSCTGKTKIIIRRTGGNARGTIRIYEFTGNGNYTRLLKSETFEANQSKKEFLIPSSKKLKIELKNVSIGKTLKYKMNALATK